jgi:hypothetical protein
VPESPAPILPSAELTNACPNSSKSGTVDLPFLNGDRHVPVALLADLYFGYRMTSLHRREGLRQSNRAASAISIAFPDSAGGPKAQLPQNRPRGSRTLQAIWRTPSGRCPSPCHPNRLGWEWDVSVN